MIRILPWEGGSLDEDEKNPPKRLIDKPREGASDPQSDTIWVDL